jgi:hypothetical protein
VKRKNEAISEKEQELVPQLKKRNWISRGDQPSIYANQAEVHTSNWDIKIRLGEAIPADIENTVIETARIVMSPQHAKAFVAVIADAVRRYEAAFGEINPFVTKAPEKTQ